jgi:hypothetical protein
LFQPDLPCALGIAFRSFTADRTVACRQRSILILGGCPSQTACRIASRHRVLIVLPGSSGRRPGAGDGMAASGTYPPRIARSGDTRVRAYGWSSGEPADAAISHTAAMSAFRQMIMELLPDSLPRHHEPGSSPSATSCTCRAPAATECLRLVHSQFPKQIRSPRG